MTSTTPSRRPLAASPRSGVAGGPGVKPATPEGRRAAWKDPNGDDR